MKFPRFFSKFLPATMLLCSLGANAAVITSTVGNGAHGLTDGTTYEVNPPLFPTPGATYIADVQAGQAAPFHAAIGGELFADPALVSWAFPGLPVITDPILSATLTIGVYDIDSAVGGSQLDAFNVDGNDLTATLDGMFEGAASVDSEFNIFTIDLSSILASLVDGSVQVGIDVGGNGSNPNLFGPPQTTDFNAFHLIFAQINITTDDSTQPPPPPPGVPEPSSLMLFALALFGVKRFTRR